VLCGGGGGGGGWRKWKKHTSSTCVWKASISSQRLRMRSSSLGKSIDIVAGVGEEGRHGRGEYFVPCIGPRLTQAVRAKRGAAFAHARMLSPPTTALITALDLSSQHTRPGIELSSLLFQSCLLLLLFHHALAKRIAIRDRAPAITTLTCLGV
jgi:hypothetical protein